MAESVKKQIIDYIVELLYNDVPHASIREMVIDSYNVNREAYTSLFNQAFSKI